MFLEQLVFPADIPLHGAGRFGVVLGHDQPDAPVPQGQVANYAGDAFFGPGSLLLELRPANLLPRLFPTVVVPKYTAVARTVDCYYIPRLFIALDEPDGFTPFGASGPLVVPAELCDRQNQYRRCRHIFELCARQRMD